MQGGPAWFIHLLCLVFSRGPRHPRLWRVPGAGGLRSTGMAITFAVIAVTALVLVAQGFSYLAGESDEGSSAQGRSAPGGPHLGSFADHWRAQ